MKSVKVIRYNFLLFFCLLTQFLHSCGLVDEPTSSTVCISNCSSSPSVPSASAQQVGVFVDSPVAGITFQSNSGLSGTTNSEGEFDYQPGDAVSFSLGGVDLGSVTGAAVLTPVEVMGATETADDKVINLTRFLQSLDEDGDPTNGINISSSVSSSLQGQSINFNDNSSNFETAVSSVVSSAIPGRTLIDATTALNHLHGSMEDWGKNDKVSDEIQMKRKIPSFVSENETWPLQLQENLTIGIADRFNNLYLTGATANGNATLKKYNPRGKLRWEQQRQDILFWTSLDTDALGNIYLLANRVSDNASIYSKYDKDGNELWSKTVPPHETLAGIKVMESGEFYISNQSNDPFNNSLQHFIIKFDSDGNEAQRITLNDFLSDQVYPFDWELGEDGSIYVLTANLNQYPPIPACINSLSELEALPFERSHLEKYNATGKRIWKKRIATESSFAVPSGMSMNHEGDIYLGGNRFEWSSDNPDFFDSFFVEKYSSAGELLWTTQPGIASSGGGLHSGELDAKGNLYLVGISIYTTLSPSI